MRTSWNRLSGLRLRFYLFSVLFWIAAPASTVALADAIGAGFGVFVFWIFFVFVIAPVLSRFFAMTMVQGYLNVVRAKPLKAIYPRAWDILRTGALSVAPFVAGTIASGIVMAGITAAVDLSETMWGIITMITLFGPLVVFLPLSWASNPFWVDRNESFFEGMRHGILLIKSNPIGAMKVTAVAFGLTLGSGLLLGNIADFWSKAAFTEAYLRATESTA